jgi:hypothetical protein
MEGAKRSEEGIQVRSESHHRISIVKLSEISGLCVTYLHFLSRIVLNLLEAQSALSLTHIYLIALMLIPIQILQFKCNEHNEGFKTHKISATRKHLRDPPNEVDPSHAISLLNDPSHHDSNIKITFFRVWSAKITSKANILLSRLVQLQIESANESRKNQIKLSIRQTVSQVSGEVLDGNFQIIRTSFPDRFGYPWRN